MLRTEEITTTVMKMRIWEEVSSFSSTIKFGDKEIVVPEKLFAQSKDVNLVDLRAINRYLLDSETLRSLADYLDSMPEYVNDAVTKKEQKVTKTFSLGH
jgi:hypothetical protein